MSKSEDVNTLYRRFGGNAGTYQEIGANEMAGAATRRWPILGELRPQAHREAPDARKGNTAIGERQVGSFLTPADGAVNAPPMPENVESMTMGDEASVAVPQSLPVTVTVTAPVGAEPQIPKVVPEPEPEPVEPQPAPEPEPPVVVVTPLHPEPETGSPTDPTTPADPHNEAEQETGTTFTSPLHPQDPSRHDVTIGLPVGTKPDDLVSVLHPADPAASIDDVVLPGSSSVLHP